MQITIIPDVISKQSAAILVDGAVRRANYHDGDARQEPVLNSLLRSWSLADCDFSAWSAAHPRLAKELADLVHEWHVFFRPASARALPIITDSQPVGTQGRITDRISGLRAFAWFLLVGAPHFQVGICDRCGNLYWNKSGHQNKRFCGRKCAKLQTAIEGQQKRLIGERKEKNKRLRLAIREFVTRKPAGTDWREWISRRAGVSKSFLTRALRRGERGEPDGLVLTKQQRRILEVRQGK